MGQGEFLHVNLFTSVFTLINSLLLFRVLTKVLWKPVMKLIAERQQEIDRMYADAGTAKEQAEKMKREYREKMADANNKAEQIVKEAKRQGQEKQDEMIRQAQLEVKSIRERSMADVMNEKQKAINEAKNEIVVIAMDIAVKALGKSLNRTTQTSLIESFVDALGDET